MEKKVGRVCVLIIKLRRKLIFLPYLIKRIANIRSIIYIFVPQSEYIKSRNVFAYLGKDH